MNSKIIKFGFILGFLRLFEVHFLCFQTQKQENKHITEGILLWAHGYLDIVQRRHYFRTIRSDVYRHLIILSEFGSLSRPSIVQKRVGPNRVRRRFRPIDYSLNPDLDLGFGSAISLNFDPNLGPVQVGSGSNAVQNRTSASLVTTIT